MTSLIVWFAADRKARLGFVPASVYVASDSRVSGDVFGRWDYGKKVFACSTAPDLFAYVGDCLYGALMLSQIVGAIDHGYLYDSDDSIEIKFSKVEQLLRAGWDSYPRPPDFSLRVIHVARQGDNVDCTFWIREYVFSANGKVKCLEPLPAPSGEVSRALLVRGTGTGSVTDNISTWNQRYANRHTSRAVFAAFCESLRSGKDVGSGGAPQLVGLYRIGQARTFGIIWEGKRYYAGLPTLSVANKDAVAWRNDVFELVDQGTKKRKARAAVHLTVSDIPLDR